jgi:hypothetical protein
MDSNQATVSGSNTVPSLAFQMVEEILKCRRTEVFQLQSNHLPIASLGGEAEKEQKGVPVGHDGVGTDVPLADHMIFEKAA